MNMSEENRKRLWLLAYASQSFSHAVNACNLLLAHVRSNEENTYLPLVAAIHVYYHRPFDRNWGAGSLQESMVPAKFKPIHDFVTSFRDSVFVHCQATDLKGLEAPINNVFLRIGSTVTVESIDPRPRIETYRDVKLLIDEMQKIVLSETSDFLKQHLNDLPIETGDYLVTLTGPSAFVKQ
jgi:hypothetical protein